MTTIFVNGVSAVVANPDKLTSGRVGLKIALFLDSETWDGLTSIISFRGSNQVKCEEFVPALHQPVEGKIFGEVTVPHAVLAMPYSHVLVGIRGVDDNNVEVVPSIYADLGVIEQGATSEGGGDDPVEKEWIERLMEAAEAAETIAQSVRDDADDGVFNGTDGRDGVDGAPGQDGVSPTVTITTITGGHRVTITDGTGDHTYDVLDGADGQTGPAGADGKDGVDGKDGQNGQDGVSPTVSSSAITGGHRLTIVDAAGTTTVDVMDGQNGQNGQDGSDYVITQADYQEIADIVLAALDNADEEAY